MSKKNKRRPAPRRVARHIKVRTGLVFFVVLGLMCFLLIRIILINRYDGENYNKTILSQMSYGSQVLQAERGQILDRNGTSLAYNEKCYNLILEPKNILEKEENTEATIAALVACYGFDRKELEKVITSHKESYYVLLKKQISEKDYQKFLDYKETYENTDTTEETELETSAEKASASKEETKQEGSSKANDTETESADDKEGSSGNPVADTFAKIKKFFSNTESKHTEKKKKGKIIGVTFEYNYKRIYPYNRLASTTIGFANSSGGVAGLEAQYNDVLKGTDGRRYGYLSNESSVEVQTIEEIDGYSLVSTIDYNIQKICEQIINKYEKDTGSNVTSLMVMNPNNGEIYAMASSRQYNLNKPADLSDLFSEKEIAEMTQKEKSKQLLLRWRNFCTTSSYEPGSTAKVFTVAAGLEESILKPEDTFVCDGVGQYGGSRIHCHKTSGHGSLNVTGALMASCNDALMQMGARIGKDIFCDYQSKFNFGQKTGVDLPDELSCANQIYRADNMTMVDLATNSFGQNYFVTMVQMCSAYASLVNGGNYYQPHVVKQIVDNENNVIKKIEPVVVRQTVSKTTSEFMKEALLQVVENGTGNRVKIDGYEIGGKTGTAEKANVGDAKETYTVSFMAVAPAYDPEVIVYAVVDEPNCTKAENTYQAKDVCRSALTQILPYLNIYPTADDEEVSDKNGDFTAPEDDEVYDDDTSIIESPDEVREADRLRKAAQKAGKRNNTNQNNTNQNR